MRYLIVSAGNQVTLFLLSVKDRKKLFRICPDSGLGHFRLFLTPPGLIELKDLPDKWGLLEYQNSGRIKIIRFHDRGYCGRADFTSNEHNERLMLISALRREQLKNGVR